MTEEKLPQEPAGIPEGDAPGADTQQDSAAVPEESANGNREHKPIIIKRGAANIITPSGKKLLKKSEITAVTTAKDIIDKAQKYADDLMRSQEAALKAAREKGFKQGYEEGLKQLNEALLQVQRFRQEAMGRIEKEIIKLALKVARKILGYELERNDSAIIAIIKENLKASRHQESIRLQVNPDDYEQVKARKQELLAVLSQCEDFSLYADESVKPGGCEIETENGSISADLDAQLDVLEAILLRKEI